MDSVCPASLFLLQQELRAVSQPSTPSWHDDFLAYSQYAISPNAKVRSRTLLRILFAPRDAGFSRTRALMNVQAIGVAV
jgi:hypothetical protein